MKKETKKGNIQDLQLMMDISTQIMTTVIKKMKKDFPKLKIGKDYDGELKTYYQEYIKQFLQADYEFAKKEWKGKELKETKQELIMEAIHIECFLNWLKNEKKIKIKITK